MERPSVITLISENAVTVDGTLCCTASGNVECKEPAICITANGVTTNGIIRCEPNKGSIGIQCREYENTGMIHPEPDIMIMIHHHHILGKHKKQRAKRWSKKEEMIALSVYDHRGSHGGYHPDNLLMDNSSSSSRSNSKLNPIGDWIIFKMESPRIMKPSAVSIRNIKGKYGIKSLSFWMGRDDANWVKMAEDVEGIENENKDSQKFGLSLSVSDDVLVEKGSDLLMIEVVENHGHKKYNRFCSFQLFGCELINK